MFGNLGSISNILAGLGDIKENMEKMKDELKELEVDGESGGGKVRVTAGGDFSIRRLKIDPELTADPEMLEDLIAAAANDALGKAKAEARKKMGELTGGLGIDLPSIM